MRTYLNIGSSPANEDCAQTIDPDYTYKAKKECQRFIELIRASCGKEPIGAQLAIKSFSNDFGHYYEVVCYYEENLIDSVTYAYKVEAKAPAKWGYCKGCGECWPCSDVKRTDISGYERSKHAGPVFK